MENIELQKPLEKNDLTALHNFCESNHPAEVADCNGYVS